MRSTGLVVLLVCWAVSAGARTWTSRSGQKLEADYVKQAYGSVTLKSSEGKLFRFPGGHAIAPAGVTDTCISWLEEDWNKSGSTKK